MRLSLSAVILLIAVAPALAQTGSAGTAQNPPPPQTTPVAPRLSPIPSAKAAEQCRADCARTYYFCLAENEPSDCAPQWSQCRISCNAPGR